jgi:hypothetical protein
MPYHPGRVNPTPMVMACLSLYAGAAAYLPQYGVCQLKKRTTFFFTVLFNSDKYYEQLELLPIDLTPLNN